MRLSGLLVVCVFTLYACDDNRFYEKNTDFKQRYWLATEKPSFEFEITDVNIPYSLFLTVRNESSYPNSNLYFTYYLYDENGQEIQKKLISEFLFDQKTGKPLGSSGLGDIYANRFAMLKDYSFPTPGKYSIQFEQFMRTDTLHGILSVGLRIEKDGN